MMILEKTIFPMYLIKNIKRVFKNKVFFIAASLFIFQFFFVNIKANQKIFNLTLEDFQERVGAYSLGPGDKLKIDIFNFNELSSTTTILPDGTINLPRIKPLNIKGFSLEEAKLLIGNEYKNLIKTPIIYINLVKPKAIKVNVLGEVQIAGLYSLTKLENNKLKTKSDYEGDLITSKGWPTLIDSIQKSGGFTINSDLRNIKLSRKDKLTNKVITTQINLWKAISKNNYFENPYIYDGDVIVVGKINSLDESEVYTIANSAFSPSKMSINIVGSVPNPGIKKIRTNTRLMQAIYSAGGLNRLSNKSKIKLVRLNSSGRILSSNYKYNEKLFNNNKLNPFLRDGDVIVVYDNNLYKTTKLLTDVLSPVEPLIRTRLLFNLFNN